MKTGFKALCAFLLGIIITLGIPALILAIGVVNFAASESPGPIERNIAPWAIQRSIESRAKKTSNPLPQNGETIEAGMEHFKETCVLCHGAPGVKASEFAAGLNPAAPDLAEPMTQHHTDAELFWITKHGIRMTGMPAFGSTHSDKEIWQLLTFVRHLPDLTPQERQQLSDATGGHKTQSKPKEPSEKPASDIAP